MQRLVILVVVLVTLFLMHVGPAGPAFAKEVIKLGLVTIPGSAQNICAEKFKELLESRSDYEVKIYHSATLGTETEILQQIQMNSVQMGVITDGPFDVFVPEAARNHRNGIDVADVPEELVAESLTLVRILDQAGDVDAFECRRSPRAVAISRQSPNDQYQQRIDVLDNKNQTSRRARSRIRVN